MRTLKQKPQFGKIILGFIVSLTVALTVSAVGWYENQSVKLGSVEVHELADWMIQGQNDYTTIYIAPKVTKIQKINGLVCITEDGAILEELAKLPAHKKWVVITPEGEVTAQTQKVISQTQAETVLVLEGGKSAWDQKVLAADLSDIDLDPTERVALDNVRPFFHGDAAKPVAATASVVTAVNMEADSADEEEVEEEEGC